MSNPWLSIPLKDYEGHMEAPNVNQLTALSELFRSVLERYLPESVAVLGVAGGNGLDQIDCSVTKRIVGVDVNPQFLDEVRKRFEALPGLELQRCDLANEKLSLAPANLVHAALIFEHAGIGLALENALSLVTPGGRFSVVLQMPSKEEQGVASTGYASIQALKEHFAFIDINEFQNLLEEMGFQLAEQKTQALPAGKALWLGVFSKGNDIYRKAPK